MSALEKIRAKVTVDIDQLDPQLAARLGPFCDMSQLCPFSVDQDIDLCSQQPGVDSQLCDDQSRLPNSETVLGTGST